MLLCASLLILASTRGPRRVRLRNSDFEDPAFSQLLVCDVGDCVSAFSSALAFADGEETFAKFPVRIKRRRHVMLVTNYAIRFVDRNLSQFAVPITAVAIIEQLGRTQLNFTSSVKKWMVLQFDRNIEASELRDVIEAAQERMLRLQNVESHHLSSEPDYLLKEYCNGIESPCQVFHNYHREYSQVDGEPVYTWYCRTYSPRDIVPGLPKTIEAFPGIVEARGRNRFLLVSYVAPSGGVLLRCSQPCTEYDVSQMAIENEARYLRDVFPDRKISVFDLRPRSSAYANLKQGGGYEDISLFGRGAEITFCGIENILVVSKSFEQDHDRWRQQLFVIFDNLKAVCDCLKDGRVVIAHCTDGWDRTPQMASLPQIVLDPRARTIRGFLTIVIREFSRRGHNMGLRNGLFKEIRSEWNSTAMFEKSPILVQFFDLVFQLISVNPTSFEFTPKLLEFLSWHVYSCQFAELLGDDAMIRLKNYNYDYAKLLDYILENDDLLSTFLNPSYDSDAPDELVVPSDDDYTLFDAIHTCFFPGGCQP